MDDGPRDERTDIFISYSHDDDATAPYQESGWIADFHAALSSRIKQIRGEDLSIFRDPATQGVGATLDEFIQSKVLSTEYLLVVMSPPYLRSDWCAEERRAFIESRGFDDGLRRIVRVDKLSIPEDIPIPAELRRHFAYRFYDEDDQKKITKEINYRTDLESRTRYETLITELAHHFVRELQAATKVDKTTENTVYLAETTKDVSGYRDRVAAELQHRGFHVLPEVRLDLIAEEAKTSISGYLSRSCMSVHIAGATHRPMIESDFSLVELQFRGAAELCEEGNIETYFWVPELDDGADDAQRTFINEVQERNISDFMVGNIEAFKGEIIERLQARSRQQRPGNVRNVCLHYAEVDAPSRSDNRSTNHVKQLSQYLFDRNCEVWEPDFDDPNQQEEDLEACDAAILYLGASEAFNREVLKKLSRDQLIERNRPFDFLLVYAENGVDVRPTRKATVFSASGDFDAEALESQIGILAGD